MNDIEQRRRDLMTVDRELYNYISDRERAKAMDHLGDILSGHGQHGAANLAWSESARFERKWREAVGS